MMLTPKLDRTIEAPFREEISRGVTKRDSTQKMYVVRS